MPLLQAKCTNCGANLQVDAEKEAAVCPYCNTPYVVEKAIANYYMNIAQENGQANIGGIEQAGNVVYNVNIYNNHTHQEKTAIVANNTQINMKSNKERLVAFLLCLLFGYFGVHRFYVGKKGSGILWLCTVGLCGYGWIIDLVLIALGKFKDKDGLLLQ